jgi:hypothetical protein
MSLEEPSQKEVDEAFEYLRELRKDPAEFDRWVDRVGKGWLRKKGKSSRRRSKASKRR